MVNENTKTHYCRKIRIYPKKELKIVFEQCFGATRYLINKALTEIKNGNLKPTSSAITMRNHLKYQNKNLSEEEQWLKEVPYDTRENAIRQLVSNFKTVFTQLKNKQITKFTMKYKSRKREKQICFIDSRALKDHKLKNHKYLFVNKFKGNKENCSFRLKENINKIINHGNMTLIKEKNKYLFLFH